MSDKSLEIFNSYFEILFKPRKIPGNRLTLVVNFSTACVFFSVKKIKPQSRIGFYELKEIK